MLNMRRITEGFLDPITRVVEQMREHAPGIDPDQVMLVGAWCRDTLHAALGHDFETSATRDIDLALALSGWETFELLSSALSPVGRTGIAFKIDGLTVDLLPFGELEDPRGIVLPPTRSDAISVWAFAEILNSSFRLVLSPSLAIRCPTVPGYTAAKLAAWLDRSEWGEAKDANDLALTARWYMESKLVENRLYETPHGQQILVAEEADLMRSAVRMLGSDVADLVGPERLSELLERWPGDLDMLLRNFHVRTGPRRLDSQPRRLEVINALTRGLTEQI